ncbi:MAG: helix-turn-helix domain-containing protein [Bacteroidota bacterium]
MEVSRELLFFISALGAFNGLLMGLYFLFFARPQHKSNYFLGALLLVLSVRTGKSVFFYFNDDLAGLYIHIGLVACFFIGPTLYFYLRSVIQPNGKHHYWKYHLAVLLPLILTVSWLYPWEDYRPLWQRYFVSLIYYEWLAYLLAAGWLMLPVFRQFWQSKEKLHSVEIWILSVFIGNVLIYIAYNGWAYTSYITGAVTFTFIFYLLVLLIILNKKKDLILFKLPEKYGAKKFDEQAANSLAKRLEDLMKTEKLYTDPKLKMAIVAEKLNLLPNQLSQLVNDNLGMSFSTLVNEYRVKEAQEQLLQNDQFTLEAIGYTCGFNSKSSFYATFKKVTGQTPAQYKRGEREKVRD